MLNRNILRYTIKFYKLPYKEKRLAITHGKQKWWFLDWYDAF